MNTAERALTRKLDGNWQDATPGLWVRAYSRGRQVIDLQIGDVYKYYDWASLTKIVMTTTALMMLFEDRKFKLDDPVCKWVSWFPDRKGLTLARLLSHSAGMTWWYPFYKKIKLNKGDGPEEAYEVFESLLKRTIRSEVKNNHHFGLSPVVYSDLDLFTLGFVLQNMTGQTLYEVWQMVRDRLGLASTDYHRNNRPKSARHNYAPTEECPWRKKTLQGEVHDENCWSLRGVAPHAGLFGPMDDLARFGLAVRAAKLDIAPSQAKKTDFVCQKTIQLFTRRAVPKSIGDWALGFTIPGSTNPSCGPRFSKVSTGHTGFTGTSLWFDPRRDLLVSILSNRVHPTRENRNFVFLRPKIHTWITEALW